jgi:hypothetical protein
MLDTRHLEQLGPQVVCTALAAHSLNHKGSYLPVFLCLALVPCRLDSGWQIATEHVSSLLNLVWQHPVVQC